MVSDIKLVELKLKETNKEYAHEFEHQYDFILER